MTSSSKKFQIFLISAVFCMNCVNGANEGKPSNQAPTQDSRCFLPMDPGPCRMNLERFYYDAKSNRCEPFKFGGCKGNDNKFGFVKTCEDACAIKTAAPVTLKRDSAGIISTKTESDSKAKASSVITEAERKPVIPVTTSKSSVSSTTHKTIKK